MCGTASDQPEAKLQRHLPRLLGPEAAETPVLREWLVSFQVPLQNNAEDWKLGNLSCYDAACVARLQTTLKLDFKGIAEGTPRDCLAQKMPDEFEAMLVAETMKADPDALGRLMADHTQVTHLISCASSKTIEWMHSCCTPDLVLA